MSSVENTVHTVTYLVMSSVENTVHTVTYLVMSSVENTVHTVTYLVMSSVEKGRRRNERKSVGKRKKGQGPGTRRGWEVRRGPG